MTQTGSRAPYSITSSAVASSLSGTVMPSALAVLRLITNSNVVGCSTGKSAGVGARKNFIHVGARSPETGRDARAVGHEAASLGGLLLRKERRQVGRRRECHDTGVLTKEHRVCQNDQSASVRCGDRGKSAVELVRRRCLHDVKLDAQRLRRGLCLLEQQGVTRV